MPEGYRIAAATPGAIVLERFSPAASDYRGNPIQPGGWSFWDRCNEGDAPALAFMLDAIGAGS